MKKSATRQTKSARKPSVPPQSSSVELEPSVATATPSTQTQVETRVSPTSSVNFVGAGDTKCWGNVSEERILQISNDIGEDMNINTHTKRELWAVCRYWMIQHSLELAARSTLGLECTSAVIGCLDTVIKAAEEVKPK